MNSTDSALKFIVDRYYKYSNEKHDGYTEIPAYSDTVYSDTPLTVTLWADPKSFINQLSV